MVGFGFAPREETMFNRNPRDNGPRPFWRWFAAEAQGLANGIEALARGEADPDWLLAGLNARIRRFDPTLQADLFRTLDGGCQMTVTGGSDDALLRLLNSAPALAGWRFSSPAGLADTRRVPFRLAPRPSLDAASPIEARHEAYA